MALSRSTLIQENGLSNDTRENWRSKNSMEFVDTNIILRYLLEDHEEQFAEATRILETSESFISFEVVAEAVYVLMSV